MTWTDMNTAAAYLLARLRESSTWATIGGALAFLHFSVSTGAWADVTTIGTGVAFLLGFLLKEKGADAMTAATSLQAAVDALEDLFNRAKPALNTAAKAMSICLVIGVAFVLASCAQVQQVQNEVCPYVLKLEQNTLADDLLNSLDPHSAVGVLWAEAKAGCAPGANVSQVWLQAVVGELESLAKTIPGLSGLLEQAPNAN